MQKRLLKLFLSEYLKNRFGCKVYKLSLSTGCTCPNRDGTKGYGGCSFCSMGGSGEFCEQGSINEQIENARKRIVSKLPKTLSVKFIAYFQSFTNTYVTEKITAEYLQSLFKAAAENDDVCAVSIGTRPDCINEEIVSMLKSVSKIKPVWIELGLQTIHDKTAEIINRGYFLDEFNRAYNLLKSSGVETIVHLIFGLPGETESMMLESVRYVAELKPDGVKLQNLQILKGSQLESDYSSCTVFSMEEYGQLLKKIIPLFHEETIIHRITGDGPKKILIEPQWSGDKKRVLNYFKQLGFM